jgi:transketolase
MTPARPGPSPAEAFPRGLLAAAERDLTVQFVEAGNAPTAAGEAFASRFPARYVHHTGPGFAADAAERARSGGRVFAAASVADLTGELYPSIVTSIARPRARVTLVGLPSPSGAAPRAAENRDDVQAFRGLPSTTVVVPADGPTVLSATAALAEREGTAYLRLPPPEAPAITDGAFSVGRAEELRPGGDLCVIAYGPPLALALDAAEELARVGLAVRVLDAACVKPLDEGAVLRAARDTGAILVVEDAPVSTGVGTLIAAMTAENAPVPVRRLGLPDLWDVAGGPAVPGFAGVTPERVREEAFELLRLRGRTA